MDKKGQLGISIIGAIFVFIIFLTSVNFIIDEVTNATANLNCDSASTISDGTKFICLVVDTVVIYWVWLALTTAIGIVIVRFVI